MSPVSTRSLKRTRRAPRTDRTNYCTWPCDCGGTITSITNQTNAHVLVTVPPQRRAEVPIRTLGERVYFMYRTKLLSFGLWALFKWNRTQTPVLEATSSSRSSVNHSHTLFHTSLRTDLCVLRAVNSPTRTLSHLPRRLVYIRLYSLYIQYDIWSFFFFFLSWIYVCVLSFWILVLAHTPSWIVAMISEFPSGINKVSQLVS